MEARFSEHRCCTSTRIRVRFAQMLWQGRTFSVVSHNLGHKFG
jgi:hypothetical protein